LGLAAYFWQAPLLLSPIRPPLQGNELSIHTESIQDGSGCYGVKDLSPVGGDEVGGDERGSDFSPPGDDLKEGIRLLFGR